MLNTRGLTYQYPGAVPLVFPDVDVPQGHTLLISGPSGAGKSTWLALVAGLLRPTQGELWVAGQALKGLGLAALDTWRASAIGFVPQKLHLSEALTVCQNLELVYFAAGRVVDGAAVQRALQALGVADLGGRRPGQISGGQAQRVALARAVLLQPRVLLADEPTASLDDEAAAAALQLLQGSASQVGATLVVATHDARVRQALENGVLATNLRKIRLESAPSGHLLL